MQGACFFLFLVGEKVGIKRGVNMNPEQTEKKPKQTDINPDQTEKSVDLITDENFLFLHGRAQGINFFEISGMQDMEIKHSATIAWFMRPLENHGLGNIFSVCPQSRLLCGQNLAFAYANAFFKVVCL
jgi:hypothetical protein